MLKYTLTQGMLIISVIDNLQHLQVKTYKFQNHQKKRKHTTLTYPNNEDLTQHDSPDLNRSMTELEELSFKSSNGPTSKNDTTPLNSLIHQIEDLEDTSPSINEHNRVPETSTPTYSASANLLEDMIIAGKKMKQESDQTILDIAHISAHTETIQINNSISSNDPSATNSDQAPSL